MKNVDEHKKLLEQIAELEKNSVNHFDVEKEFFLIDSNNLAKIETRFYGYSIQATGIYEQDNLTEEAIAGLDGRGCYVYVEVKDGHITIKQDLNGSWGLYLFRHGDYFALSNSFFRLLDYIKFRYPLTVNRDYCHYLLINGVSSHSYSETSVNEIQLVERNAVLRIDIAEKNLEIELLNYREHTIPPDSEEGIAVLDRWVELWGNVFRGIAQHTKFFQASLSGGFDTRISFVILRHSGVDCNKIRFNSANSLLHTFKEDYAIASKIADHYGFKLNRPFPERRSLNFSVADVFNINLYSCQTFSNLPKLSSQKNVDKIYELGGFAGEIIRGNWLRFGSLEKFINLQKRMTNPYSHKLSHELFNSMKNILESAFHAIQKKYDIQDKNSLYLAQYLYQETRCRHHFGKNSLSAYLTNTIHLIPANDPEIRTLRIESLGCPDHQLIMALLFARYESDLLNFPFEGKRFIAQETIAYAQKVNERFPRNKTVVEGNRGGYFICSRVICKRRKSSRPLRIILPTYCSRII